MIVCAASLIACSELKVTPTGEPYNAPAETMVIETPLASPYAVPVETPVKVTTPANPFIIPAETWSPQPDYRVGFAWFYKPPEDKNQIKLLPEKFQFFILTHRDEEERDSLRSLGVTEPIPVYLLLAEIQDPGSCEKEPRGNQVAYLPGDFCRISAEHPDWFLLDKSGNRILDDDNYYNMDFGNPGFRAFWLERALELQRAHGWNGLFLDNVEASLSKYEKAGALPVLYPEDTSMVAAVEGFLANLQAANIGPLFANIVSMEDSTTWLRYLKYLDGAMLENFAVDWRDGTFSPDVWTAEMEMLSSGLHKEKTLILVAQGHRNDLERQKFAFASYLLINEGKSFFRYAHHSAYREVWWYDNYDINLGKPLGPAYYEDGEWVREFENVWVRVNPVDQTANIEEK